MLRGILTLVLGMAVLAGRASAEERVSAALGTPKALPLQEALRKASVGGKYKMLLSQLRVPEDAKRYADFHDLGAQEIAEYAGHTNLPGGYWVYVYPYWYIWRDLSAAPVTKRRYGAEQAAGPPDTPRAGDLATAWASRTADGDDEWLLLEYEVPVVPEAVLVYENFKPGALVRVTVFKLDGSEVEVWHGKDPTDADKDSGVSEIKFQCSFKTNRVRIELDSRRVPGWNEIDAVGLRDSGGRTQWAASVHASSVYGTPPRQEIARQPAQPPVIQPVAHQVDRRELRIQQLEKEVRELKEAMRILIEQQKRKPQ
ncbi:MAG: hypothetical protein KatS3mg105_0010 [Gemmatales bacterium]|nr:MAG: hypothetical protein KatS3mg105_0010 [Gemmatales bacterium]